MKTILLNGIMETSLRVQLQSTTARYISMLGMLQTLSLASLGSAQRRLGSLNILASMEHCYLVPMLFVDACG
jgi:hypothetical protein